MSHDPLPMPAQPVARRSADSGPRTLLRAAPVLGAIAVICLLIAYVSVVRQAVRQGDAGRRTSVLLEEAGWRCRVLKLPRQRDDCLRLVRQERPADSAAVRALVSAAGAMTTPSLPP